LQRVRHDGEAAEGGVEDMSNINEYLALLEAAPSIPRGAVMRPALPPFEWARIEVLRALRSGNRSMLSPVLAAAVNLPGAYVSQERLESIVRLFTGAGWNIYDAAQAAYGVTVAQLTFEAERLRANPR
jgi:hypothetical protein